MIISVNTALYISVLVFKRYTITYFNTLRNDLYFNRFMYLY